MAERRRKGDGGRWKGDGGRWKGDGGGGNDAPRLCRVPLPPSPFQIPPCLFRLILPFPSPPHLAREFPGVLGLHAHYPGNSLSLPQTVS